MAGHKADEKIPVQLGDLRQQIRKIHAAIQILAVGIYILSQQSDLLNAGGGKFSALSQDVLRSAAALPSPHIGHDAVSAEIIAAVHDAYPGLQLIAADHGQTLSNGAGLVGDVELPLAGGQYLV